MTNLINEVEKLQKAAGIVKEAAPMMAQAAPAKDTRRSDVKAYDKGASGIFQESVIDSLNDP